MRVERKLSEILSENIEPMSPLTIDYQGQRFSSFSSNTTDPSNPSTHVQAPATSGEMSHLNKSRTLDASKRYVECAHGVRDSWVDIQLIKQGGGAVNGEGGVRGGNGVDGKGSFLEPRAGGFTGGSLDRVSYTCGYNLYTCLFRHDTLCTHVLINLLVWPASVDIGVVRSRTIFP